MQLLWWSVKGFGVARGRISGFPIDLRRRPYNTIALPCECVMTVSLLSAGPDITDVATAQRKSALSSDIVNVEH